MGAGHRRHSFFKAVLVDAKAGKLLGSMDSSLVTAPLPYRAPADLRCTADGTVEFLLGTNLVQVGFADCP